MNDTRRHLFDRAVVGLLALGIGGAIYGAGPSLDRLVRGTGTASDPATRLVVEKSNPQASTQTTLQLMDAATVDAPTRLRISETGRVSVDVWIESYISSAVVDDGMIGVTGEVQHLYALEHRIDASGAGLAFAALHASDVQSFDTPVEIFDRLSWEWTVTGESLGHKQIILRGVPGDTLTWPRWSEKPDPETSGDYLSELPLAELESLARAAASTSGDVVVIPIEIVSARNLTARQEQDITLAAAVATILAFLLSLRLVRRNPGLRPSRWVFRSSRS
jgi:hypothetical protein